MLKRGVQNSNLLIMFLLVVAMINSCNPVETSAPLSLTPTIRTTNVISPSATPTEVAIAQSFPDIVSSVGILPSNPCSGVDKNQIWSTAYPYLESNLLISDSEVNYYFPTYSPDGKWIAFLASIPDVIINPTAYPNETSGSDSIWIMRPDGSDLRKIGDDFPDMIINNNSECFQISGVAFPFVWSPDGKYIAFSHFHLDDSTNAYENEYYVIEVASGKVSEILNQKDYGLPVWFYGKSLGVVVNNRESTNIVYYIDTGQTQTLTINFPPEVSAGNSPSFLRAQNSRMIYAFSVGGTLISPKPKKVSIWELNIETRVWTKLNDLRISTYSKPLVGEEYAILCDEINGLFLIDPDNNWKILDQLHIPKNELPDCTSTKVIRQANNDVALLFSNRLTATPNLWMINLQPESFEAKLLTDNSLSLPDGFSIFATDYFITVEN